MKAAAPGKLVLSGAYAVLEGAPALVAAVDRYAIADSERDATFVTDEVAEAIAAGCLSRAPYFDASALRQRGPGGDRKLGLGSSAAILAASIAAVWAAEGREDWDDVFAVALAAHRRAQGGGSGIDVAASCLGGFLRCQLVNNELSHAPHALPDVTIEVYASRTSAATRDMLAAVRVFQGAEPARYRNLMDAAGSGAQAAVSATAPDQFIAALSQQFAALAELGDGAGVQIVTDAVRQLDRVAQQHDACFGPSGAGGGDVALWVGTVPAAPEFRARAADAGLCLVDMRVGARGLHRP